jgi:hypothetical protein
MLWLIVLFVVAIAFWGAGGLLLYVRHRTRRKVDLMRQTQTTDASGVSAFPPGTSVEVEGTLRCESPLQSEMAGESCACYFSRVTREYVRTSGPSSDDSPGSHHTRQTASETLAESVRAVPFLVEDGTSVTSTSSRLGSRSGWSEHPTSRSPKRRRSLLHPRIMPSGA